MSKLGKLLLGLSVASLISFAIVKVILGAWVPFLWLALGCFAGSFIGAVWVDRRIYKDFLTMKTTRQGMSMGAMIGLVLVLVIAVNFIAVRKYATFDFSIGQVNTLSDQSIKLLGSLKDDLHVIYFYKNGTEGVENAKRAFTDLIKKYADQSDKVKLDFVEINEHPDLTEKYGIKQGTQVVIMEYQGRQSRIEKIDEQELTSGIVKVIREKEKKVYFLTGHAELGFQKMADGSSLVELKDVLTGSRYTVEEFSLTKSTLIPADADMVVIVGPKLDFLDVEVRAVEDYLRKGGNVIIALSSNFKTGLEPMLKNLGVYAKNNYIATVVQTQMGVAVDPRFARGSVFSTASQITKPFAGNQFTVFRLPTALARLEKTPVGINIDEIVKTNDSVMAFKDTKFDKTGEKGPFTLGMAIKGKYDSKSEKEFNLVLFGDSNFLNDQYLRQDLNRDLILNSVAFLANDENLISIMPKEVEASHLEISDTQFILFVFGFIIPLPILLFAAGGVLWYRRRHA